MITAELPKPVNDLVLAGEKVNTGLIAFEAREALFTALAAEAKGLKINGIEDKEGRLKVSTVRKKIKAERRNVEKEALALRQMVGKISKDITAKENKLIAITAIEEKELQDEEDRIEAIEKKIQDDKDEAERVRIQARIDKLAVYGFAIDYATLTVINDATFETVLNDAKTQHDKAIADKEAAEKLAKQAAEKLAADLKELEELKQKAAEAQKIIDDNNARIKKEQEAKEAELKAAQKKIDDEKAAIELQKQKDIDEANRAKELEAAKLKAAEDAKLKVIEDARIATEQKELADKLAKEKADRELALRPDKEKLQAFTLKLHTIIDFTVTDPKAQLIVNDIEGMINKMEAHILSKINEL
jgi:hypothetical protein